MRSKSTEGHEHATRRRRPLAALAASLLAMSSLAVVSLAAAPAASGAPTPGVLFGWGDNSEGALGNPGIPETLVSTPSQIDLPSGVSAVQVSSAYGFTLALGSDGNVYSWGDNVDGDLGDRSTAPSSSPVEVDLPAGVTATAVAAGGATGLAIGSDGNVYAWGDNTDGQLGQGTFGGYSSTPEVVDNAATDGATVTEVAAHLGTMMELTATGLVYLWGYGEDGEMGDGGFANEALPQLTPVLSPFGGSQDVTSIAVGQEFCVVSTSTGAVYAWGFDGEGAIGDFNNYVWNAPSEYVTTPLEILADGSGAVQVTAGAYNGFALTSSGQIYAWGNESYGELGNGTGTAFLASTPVLADGPVGGGTYTEVSAGDISVSAATSTGEIDTWGADDNGQFGNGTTTNVTSATPTAATLPNGISAWGVASGDEIVYALTDGQAPEFTSVDSTTFIAGTSNTFTVATTALPTAAVDEYVSLPNGVGFVDNGNGTATLSGDPTAAEDGTYTFSIYADNGVSPEAEQVFTLTVDSQPAFTSPSSVDFYTGANETFSVTTSGYPFPSLTAGALPAGLGWTDNGNGTGTIAGTATGSPHVYHVLLTAVNGVVGPASQDLTIVVKSGVAPTFVSRDYATFEVGRNSHFTIRAKGSPAPTISTADTLPSGLVLESEPGGKAVLEGWPFLGDGGVYTITLTASNGVSPDATQTFTLTINEKPSFTPSSVQYLQLGTYSVIPVDLLSSGFPGPVVMTSPTKNLHGLTFSDLGGGEAEFSGIPTGKQGTYLFKVVATNGAGHTTDDIEVVVSNSPYGGGGGGPGT